MGVANAFSGGVFLAICSMHIMPEQTESWADYEIDFPLPFALLVGGYTLMLTIDRVLFEAHDDESKDSLKESLNKSNRIDERADRIRKSITDKKSFDE